MDSDVPRPIQKQVRLPFSVALEVVLQGIRIRMGRSVVTMMGVVLGVAFLMSILTSGAIRRGMAEETELRQEVTRMQSFLESESGPVQGRILGILITGALNEVEGRLIRQLDREGASDIRVFGLVESVPIPSFSSVRSISSSDQLGDDSSALIVMGPASCQRRRPGS